MGALETLLPVQLAQRGWLATGTLQPCLLASYHTSGLQTQALHGNVKAPMSLY